MPGASKHRIIASIIIIVLMLVTLVSWNNMQATQKSYYQEVKIYVKKEIISTLVGTDDALLASAVLAIPGQGVISGSLEDGQHEYVISFNISNIGINIDNRNSRNIPTIVINFLSYETNKVTTIIVSSYTEYLKMEVLGRLGGRVDLLAAMGKAAREASADPWLILREGRIFIGPRYAELLLATGKILVRDLSPNLRLPQELTVGANQLCDPSSGEYPYPGTGIYQKVDPDRYSYLTSRNGQSYVPDWWKRRFIDNPGYGSTAEEAYHRFARDFLSSYYLVSKARYQSVDEALHWLRDYIAVGGRDNTSEGINLISMSKYLRYDGWNNSMCCRTVRTSIPLLAYKVSHSLQDPDAKRLTRSFTIVFQMLNGAWTSGMLLAGWPLAASEHPIHSETTYMFSEPPISFYNSSAGIGAIIAENASLTFGPDYIVVYWEVDTGTCQDYYVIRPIAFIAPLYTVDYSFADMRRAYSANGDPIVDYSNELAMSYLYSWVNTTRATTDPAIDHKVLYHAIYNFSGIQHPSTAYYSAVDIPPLLVPITTLTSSSIDGPASGAILSVYSIVASTGVFIASAGTSVIVDFHIVQDAPLSREASIVITNIEAGARHAVGAPLFPSFIYIDASYENSGGGGPACGPGWCPTGNISP